MYQRPKFHIRIFRKRWSLILGYFFPVSILNPNVFRSSQSSDLAVCDRFPGGENMNLLFNSFENSNEEKLLCNRMKRFYSEM